MRTTGSPGLTRSGASCFMPISTLGSPDRGRNLNNAISPEISAIIALSGVQVDPNQSDIALEKTS